uniref:Uncharacterized protein n=1 Tax=Glossina austeni TaxID=7395 RepID=A0A1A9VDL5_GLOAU
MANIRRRTLTAKTYPKLNFNAEPKLAKLEATLEPGILSLAPGTAVPVFICDEFEDSKLVRDVPSTVSRVLKLFSQDADRGLREALNRPACLKCAAPIRTNVLNTGAVGLRLLHSTFGHASREAPIDTEKCYLLHVWKIDEDRLEAEHKSQYGIFIDDCAYIVYAASPVGGYVNQLTITREKTVSVSHLSIVLQESAMHITLSPL